MAWKILNISRKCKRIFFAFHSLPAILKTIYIAIFQINIMYENKRIKAKRKYLKVKCDRPKVIFLSCLLPHLFIFIWRKTFDPIAFSSFCEWGWSNAVSLQFPPTYKMSLSELLVQLHWHELGKRDGKRESYVGSWIINCILRMQ